MSSLIEQAAERLEQLRQAGAEMPARPEVAQAVDAAQRPVSAVQPALLSRRVDIDLEALAAAGIVSPHAPRSQIADQFRVIKRPLINNAMGKGASVIAHGNLIMVTSALAGEGKTFTAINLAMSMATELDYTVMLVDADVARPSVMKVLGLSEGPGLLDLVLGESSDMSGMLLKTNIDKLTILPAGTPHARATELLASDAMIRLLDEMANRYPDRIIIFDSPPLLLTTEARALASHMGQVVVVVQAGRTLQSEVRHALATIEACPVKLMLLNQARAVSREGYEYGYGYGYGSDMSSSRPDYSRHQPKP
ncbi:XrtA-associated tyrosine autokinase [Polaromonas sp. C04]|uniref:XrtA-associated tyrosine autokinase n=1 Tax=Polaromonas sp. C04 TaxID=1945857 RepID=UPI000985B47A|nr:XrtA-associated tyrosine autokinase [Polaromonas sp. C04]OOG54274.1 protein tyrosine kinase [Polaromonas sp. C04]